MRRAILIAMMLIPLWWSGSAVARICEHPSCGSDMAQMTEACVDTAQAQTDTEPGNADVPGNHLDCEGCHGMGAAYPVSASAPALRWPPRVLLPAYGPFFSEAPIEGLLRPPMTSVA